MHRSLLLLSVWLVAPQVALAAPSLSVQQGRWVCLPDDQSAPQVLVDFTENVYRRCDQNTCVTYDILAVRRGADRTVEIAFSPHAYLRADAAGARYAEFITTGPITVETAGSCSFRDDANH